MRLVGVFVPLVTPFCDNGTVDHKAVPRLVHHVLAGGVSGVVVAGTTGEGYALDLAERRAVIEQVIQLAGGRVPVLAGVGGMSTREAQQQARLARSLGAAGLMVAAPAYVLPTPEELTGHVRAVLDEADLPSLLYDYPGRTGVSFTPEALEPLADDPRVVGIKEASGDLSRLSWLRRRFGDSIPVVNGADVLALRYLELGVDAWIAGAANVLPAEHVALCDAAVADTPERARAWEERLMPMLRAVERNRYVAKVRYGLELRGIRVGPPRLPLAALGAPETVEVQSALAVALQQGRTP